ncbi:unnamed protein product [Leuciscus chuanchicus]
MFKRRWIWAIRREEGPTFTVRKGSTFLCSKHFTEDEVRVRESGRNYLTPQAVPSRFAWNNWGEVQLRQTRTAKRGVCCVQEEAEMESADAALLVQEHDYDSRPPPGALDEALGKIKELEELVSRLTISRSLLDRWCVSDEDFRYFTRFSSKNIFMVFWRSIEPSASKIVYWSKAKRIGISTAEKEVVKPSPQRKMQLIDEFFMFCLRVAVGLRERVLAELFGVSTSTVSRIIITWANYLYLVLGSIQIWMTREQVTRTMPVKFQQYCPNVRVIIDCTEFRCVMSLSYQEELMQQQEGRRSDTNSESGSKTSKTASSIPLRIALVWGAPLMIRPASVFAVDSFLQQASSMKLLMSDQRRRMLGFWIDPLFPPQRSLISQGSPPDSAYAGVQPSYQIPWYLKCCRCKRKVSAWSQEVVGLVGEGHRTLFPVILTYKLACDRQVIIQLREHPRGNSATQLYKKLCEAHTEAWMRRSIHYLSVMEPFTSQGVVRRCTPPPKPPPVPQYAWLLLVYCHDILSPLEDVKAIFGTVLKTTGAYVRAHGYRGCRPVVHGCGVNAEEVIQTETDLHEEEDDAEDQRRQNERNQQGEETNVGNSTATVKILLMPERHMITVAFTIGLSILDLKKHFSFKLRVPLDIIQITLDEKSVDDDQTLMDIGVQPHGMVQFEMSSLDPENYPMRPDKPQEEYNMPDVITVRVQTDTETYQDIVVEKERATCRKAFLGGFCHSVTKTEYHQPESSTLSCRWRGFDVNALLDRTLSDNYNDMRRSALYFAVSNGDLTCVEMLLNKGAKPDLDPLRCLLVAVGAGRYEFVEMLLAKQADFCDFISLCCLVDLSGRVVLILLDYVNHVPIFSHLRCILEKQKEWAEICTILSEFTGFAFNHLLV